MQSANLPDKRQFILVRHSENFAHLPIP